MDVVYHSLSEAYQFFYKRLHKGLAFEITDGKRVVLVDKVEHNRVEKVEHLYKLFHNGAFGSFYSEGADVIHVLERLNDEINTNMVIKQRDGIYIIELEKNVYALVEVGETLYGRGELRPCIYVKGLAFDIPLLGKIVDDKKFLDAVKNLSVIF